MLIVAGVYLRYNEHKQNTTGNKRQTEHCTYEKKAFRSLLGRNGF